MKRMEELPRKLSVPGQGDPFDWRSIKPPSLISRVVFTILDGRINMVRMKSIVALLPDRKVSVVPPYKSSDITVTLRNVSVPWVSGYPSANVQIERVSAVCLKFIVLASSR